MTPESSTTTDIPGTHRVSADDRRADARRTADRARRVRAGMGLLLLVVLCVTTSVVRYHHHHMLSPIDELQHIDYLDRAAHGHLLHQGQQVEAKAMEEQSCRGGVEVVGAYTDPCGGPYNPDKYQERGLDTADIHPPLYYLLTGPTARFVVWAGLWNDFASAGRALGGVWEGLALWLLGLVMLRLRASRLATALTTISLAVSPLLIRATSIVSNDAATMLTGSLLLYAMVRHRQGGCRLRWIMVAAAVSIWLRPTAILAVAVAMLFLLVTAPSDGGSPAWRSWARWRAPTFVGAAALVAQGAWLVLRAAMAVPAQAPNLIGQREHVDSLTGQMISDAVRVFVPPLGDDSYVATGSQHWHTLFLTLASWMILLGAGGGAVVARRLTPVSALSGAAVLMVVLGGPLLVISTYVTQHVYTPIPQRYGLALLPFEVAAASAAANRPARIVLVGTLVLSAVFGLYVLTHSPAL